MRCESDKFTPVKSRKAGSLKAKFDGVNKTFEGNYIARITAPPVDNQANEMLIRVLAEHFNVPKSSLTIVGGKTAKTKIIEILQ